MTPGVLFLCVANSARSQLAEGLARARFGDQLRVYSAGSHPTTVNPLAIELMREIDIDITAQTSKLVDDIHEEIDLVVTLCAEEVCPAFLRPARRLHWPIPDPAGPEPMAASGMQARFHGARRAIAARLDGVLPALATPPSTVIAPASADDRHELEALLADCNVPLDGLDDGFPRGFALARHGGALIGTAGIEQWGAHGLLRSVAIAPAQREHRVAAALVADRIAWARSLMRDEHTTPFASISLFTTDADRYFERFGFARCDRDKLPAALSASSQHATCATATAMTLRFYQTSEELLEIAVTAELAEHGTLVPPWIKYPEIPVGSIGWRMGSGEWYLDMWRHWWQRVDVTARAAYIAQWKPGRPAKWRDWL